MQDLSLHLLDIVQNSIRAQANKILIRIEEKPSKDELKMYVEDNGNGMSKEFAEHIIDPFVTSRTLRRVGLGIPLLKQNCESSDGKLEIISEPNKGTIIKAIMKYHHIDRVPLGDLVSTMVILIQSNPQIEFNYTYQYEEDSFIFKTEEIKNILKDVSIDNLEVLAWIREYISDNMENITINNKEYK